MNDLDSFPRPGVTVDIAVLTVSRPSESIPELRVLVQDRREPSGRSLPGGFIRERWTVDRTVDDVLRRKVGIEPSERNRPRLLRLFDDPDRDDRSWVMSAAHSLSLPEHDLLDATGDLVRVDPAGRLVGEPRLLFDHDEIVTAAVDGAAGALRDPLPLRRHPPRPRRFPARAVHPAPAAQGARGRRRRRAAQGQLQPADAGVRRAGDAQRQGRGLRRAAGAAGDALPEVALILATGSPSRARRDEAPNSSSRCSNGAHLSPNPLRNAPVELANLIRAVVCPRRAQ